MYFLFLFLFGVVANIEASLECPIPDYALCGNDGKTYKNVCEWKIVQLLNPSLELLHLGPCKQSSYERRYRALLLANGDRDSLRSRKCPKKKRLSSSSSSDENLIQRLADMQFNFRRDDEKRENEEEEV